MQESEVFCCSRSFRCGNISTEGREERLVIITKVSRIFGMWAGARCWIWTRIKINVAQIGASSALFYLVIVTAAMRPSYGLLVAQIWQTGPDCPNAIIPHGMWARARC